MKRHEQAILGYGVQALETILGQPDLFKQQQHGIKPKAAEGITELTIPNECVTFFIEVKDSLHPYQIKALVERHPQWMQRSNGSNRDLLLVLVRDLTRSALDQCAVAGLCVLTESGNGYIRFPRFLYHRFVPSISRRETVSGPGSVFSAKASRLVRAILARYPEVWSQSALVKETEISPGYASSMIKKMIEADYLRRDRGHLRVVDAGRLLDDWAVRYRFDRHTRYRFAISMGEYQQGLRKLQQEMQRHDIRFALTGWSAAYLRAPYGSPDALVAYVDRPVSNLQFQSLHEVQGKGNVLLLLPHDDGVFQFAEETEFGAVVADVQCYLDLLNLPGRADEQAEVLREKRLAFKDPNNE